jgi:hypothetical protein
MKDILDFKAFSISCLSAFPGHDDQELDRAPGNAGRI